MRIGLANIYSFRPHVEHLYYLAQLVEQAGHQVTYLTCDSSVKNCYPRMLKGTGRIVECGKCIVGGVRSYPTSDVTSLSSLRGVGNLSSDQLSELAISSSATLARTESAADLLLPEVAEIGASLTGPINQVYHSARAWIANKQLDAVICFNGRMDLTRAITYACEQAGIPYLTHERTWFGDGLRLIPNENCLSVRALGGLVKEFDQCPLDKDQAGIAGRLIGARFLQCNSLEWRLYNRNPEPAAWPLPNVGARVLVLPSSKNEFAGHAEWVTEWVNNTDALDDFFDAFGIKHGQVVLRCHPNWGEPIGKVTGERSREHYYSWASARGIYCIRSEDKASTYDLIRQADIVVLNGGSSAVEAGACGKQVICLGPASYQESGFVKVFRTQKELLAPGAKVLLDPEDVIKKTLRYVYLRYGRFPQFVNYVRANSTTNYSYFDGADPERLMKIIRSGKVVADDSRISDTEGFEQEVVSMLHHEDWSGLVSYASPPVDLLPLDIGRRKAMRWIDKIRDQFPRGDRA